MHSCLRLSIVALLILCIGLSGCTKLDVAQVAKHPAGKELTVAHAPRDGWYEVRYSRKGADDLKRVAGTEQWIPKGTAVGFTSEDKHHTTAIIGTEERSLPMNKRKNVKYRWYSEEVRQTQFGKEMQELGEGTMQVLGVAAVGTLVVGAVWLDLESDDDDCEHKRHCCD